MSLETGTYISDLNSSNPTSSDPKSQGDDHIRLLKSTVKATFPNITGAVSASHTDLNTVTTRALKSGDTYTGTHDFSGATAVNVPAPTASSNAATKNYADQLAFSTALPAQTGNTGKFLTTDGSAASWAISGIGQVGSSVTTDTTLTASSAGYQPVNMSALGKSITLPNATTMTVGGPRYIIDNTKGGYPCGIRDNTGTLIMAVAAGGEALVSLKDASTAAGSWSVTGTNLEPGLITIDSTFSSTYTSTVLAPFAALDNNTSIHFAALSSGFAAFVVDNTGKVLTTPVTVSSTASDKPYTAFKITTTTAIVFYGTGSTSNCVVLTLSGSSPSYSLAVGTPQTSADVAAFANEDFIGAPVVSQLTSTLYMSAWMSAGPVKCVGVAVSGATITIGTSVNIIASNGAGAPTTYPLTSTTALVLYKSGAAAPFANNAVVVTVTAGTGACAVGTPVALTGCTSASTEAPASVLVSDTKCIVQDDNNTSAVVVSTFTVSGTTVTAGTALSVETGFTFGSRGYTANYATRYNPRLWKLTTGSTNTVGLWYFDSNSKSRVVVLSETSGTITKGTIVYRSISQNTNGSGRVLTQGATEFCAITGPYGAGAATYNNRMVVVPHLINSTTINTGSTVTIPEMSAYNAPNYSVFTKLPSGDYVVSGYEPADDSTTRNFAVFRSNGAAVNYRGIVKTPYFRQATASNPIANVSAGRIVFLLANGDTTVGISTYQLRLINVEIAA